MCWLCTWGYSPVSIDRGGDGIPVLLGTDVPELGIFYSKILGSHTQKEW